VGEYANGQRELKMEGTRAQVPDNGESEYSEKNIVGFVGEREQSELHQW